MNRAKLSWHGRIIGLSPGNLGSLFHSSCTVTLMIRDTPSQENSFRPKMVPEKKVNYWYDVHPTTGEQIFYTFSGYLGLLQDKLTCLKIGYDVETLVDNNLGVPDFTQVENVHWRGRQLEVFLKALACPCGVVVSPTGWGKTFLIAQIVRAYPKADIVVTVPSKDVAKDIYRNIAEYVSDVGFVGDGKHAPNRVTVAVTNSLGHCKRSAQLVIGDECHALVSPWFREQLLHFTRAKFLGFTASPTGRSDNGDGFIEAVFGPVVVTIPYSEAVIQGNVVDLHVRVYATPHGPNVARIERKDLKDRAGLWANTQRNTRIAEVVNGLLAELGADSQVLIMVDKTEHAFRLQQLLPEFTVVTGTMDSEAVEDFQACGVMKKGQMPCSAKEREQRKQAFEKRELRLVIATMVWSKGVNFKDLDILVRADGTSSPITSTQVPGRLSRLGTTGEKTHGLLIDFDDTFSEDLKARSLKRLRSYKSHGWKISHPS